MAKFLSLVAMVMVALNMSATVTPTKCMPAKAQKSIGKDFFYKPSSLTNPNVVYANDAATRADDNVTVTPVITQANNESILLVAAIKEEADGLIYVYGSENEDMEFCFDVPEGVYDFLLLGYSGNYYDGTIMILQENVNITADSEVTFNTADATNVVNVERRGLSGELLTLMDEAGNLGNCNVGFILNIIDYKGVNILNRAQFLFTEGQNFIKTNFTQSPLSLTQMSAMASEEGLLYALQPIDFNEPVVSNLADTWQSAEFNIQPTPANLKLNEFYISKGHDPDAEAYNYADWYVYYGSYTLFGAGFGVEGAQFPTSKVHFWVPENYKGGLDIWAYPSGDCIGEGQVNSRPVHRGVNGAEMLGVNNIFGDAMIYSPEKNNFTEHNPIYTRPAENITLANCTPIFISSIRRYYPVYNFAGRHGESMSIDSFNLLDNTSEQCGNFIGATNSFVVKAGGDVICDNLDDYPYYIDWRQNTQYEVTVSTDNVLIDGVTPGVTTATLTYDFDALNQKGPSLTALQFVKETTNEITDIFTDLSEKPMMRMNAATLNFKTIATETVYFEYYECSNPESVKAEYAPKGSEDFTELELTNYPEKFFNPGYGAYYESDLSTISRSGNEGWYDLRITVTADNGAVQTQTISPAFKIDSLTGIEGISSENRSFQAWVEGRDIIAPANARIYNVNGVACNGKDLEKGLYIVTDGISNIKLLVK